ncbi:hypothetical protein [Roseimaritima ulvae]|uniref:Uncharacterized protein n=1 Tax=Roseimaritima ulvae TaxID=980254 RepID=A0A5B9QTF4_9BACT|nr:hypothetical protein [Roseimaritima ulvae]QEG42337.1 hypothetical protein UC8_43710 [Roseimaritima ulvae]
MLSYDQAVGLRNGIARLVERLHQGDIDDYTDEKLAIWYEIYRPIRETVHLHPPASGSPLLVGPASLADPRSQAEFEDHLLRIIRQDADRGEYVLQRLLRTYLQQFEFPAAA